MTERIFVFPDLHCPFEDRRATELAFDALNVIEPDVVVIIGDWVDCFAVSHWSKDPRRAFGLEDELNLAGQYLDRIPVSARRIYIAGNHEDRLQRYLQDKAPELMPFVDIQRLLDLDRRGFEFVPYRHSIQIGKVHFTHDVGSAGRYNVWKALDTYQASIVVGHTHRLGYVVEGDARGSRQLSAQFGWLGGIESVDYMHRTKALREWALGFGYGVHDLESGTIYLNPAPIVDYTVAINGKVLRRGPVAGRGKQVYFGVNLATQSERSRDLKRQRDRRYRERKKLRKLGSSLTG